MTLKLTAVFLIICNCLFAQLKPVPTKFDKFVKCSKIEWAAYASDTFRFDNAGFNNLLLTRLESKNIKASLPIESRTGDISKVNYVLYDSIFQNHFSGIYEEIPVIDTTGEIIGYQRLVPQVDTSAFKLTEVTQILYIQKGVLKSYIPWVTPTLPVITSSGKYLGESFYFNTAYNRKYKRKSRKITKLIFLSQTKKMIKLTKSVSGDILKEMYSNNLIETLWPEVLNGKIEVFSLADNEKIFPEKLNGATQLNDGVLVPFYDSAYGGRIYKYELINRPLALNKFTDAALVQNWYYDYKKNMVFSKIREMYLYVNTSSEKESVKSSPVLKLVFK